VLPRLEKPDRPAWPPREANGRKNGEEWGLEMIDLQAESVIRLGAFAGVLALMASAEWLFPRRHFVVAKPQRWLNNLALVCINTILVRILLPLGAVGMAVLAQEKGWGLFNNLDWPPWFAVILAVLALDFAIYLQHILFHAVPLLWRLHMVHHADLDFDVTTGLRFHTLEILLSMAIKLAVVVLLGASALAVLIFEILLNATSMFNHSNMGLPGWLDRVLRLLIVTPDMHRVHHSAIRAETNSNFGFNLPWWDFLLGTYKNQPALGHLDMTIGLAHLRDEKQVDRLPWMLALPILGDAGSYPINRGGEKTISPTNGRPHPYNQNLGNESFSAARK
jgi:sterol desaturase/sphingolipid hydroxylase (fatty acid hydroxylase superfamily)